MFNIEVVYGLPNKQDSRRISVERLCTVIQAIELSDILADHPEIDLGKNKVGVFGQLMALDHILQDGDRVEIYRPLIIDPKVARRLRAKSSKLSGNRSRS